MDTTAENPGDLLDPHAIAAQMSREARGHLRGISVQEETDSTNAALRRLPVEEQHGQVILAERQTAGRGRRGRRWYSPPGGNIYMSVGWYCAGAPAGIAALPLAAAVAACRALVRCGLRGHGIKWPNDIMVDGAKLAGILVELESGSGAGASAVIGIGINVAMPESEETAERIDQAWTDLSSHLDTAETAISRNRVIALLLDEMLPAVARFQAHGFASFGREWPAWDLLEGREVRVSGVDGQTTGIARGIGAQGALQLEVPSGDGPAVIQEFFAGDVSLRAS